VSSQAVYTVWGVSLLLGAVVLVVVALLLQLIWRSARRIEVTVGEIWNAGQGVANNTIHIALLHRTNLTVARILAAAGRILDAIAAIRAHAQRCPRCPDCAGGR
jgi:Na+/H+ antiporter NhaC